ncbi:rhodanese-like domain-containing protein [Clostridioides sp. ZZV14-6044]|uniref:rhodanese-like domain-containing protein n=1 Tax=unclassified Clostridioides TaxID=2635829 RepID=UPI001D10C060|nr:rhodanese-like domain-containing protein [Clostridioides sp. ZZV14-6154]MCC0665257.1 rhodanese-like domain-containing protein [Clostridioides sp. ZZV15-6597]MCC0722051.1 rhodanese-like domain-containing protein [Clostridioides sp. ZZV14-6104]MCC0725924.1 rhodanese-like domain-containing protein [Clostridioides sp. ZZV14-6045]MCC0731996.1 rhodanese-like domain-containing protein [Clostridioides sp. ZZV14-6048]MCC0735229.1 rhodanese-like domain-containing protein [Clostridioides sp. ZZV14-600
MSFFSELFKGSKHENIDGMELNILLKNNKKTLILDVRTSGEYSTFNIPKSKNIPVHELKSKLNTLDLYKNSTIVVYCASGARSNSAAKILSRNGFNSVYNLKGGISSYISKKK